MLNLALLIAAIVLLLAGLYGLHRYSVKLQRQTRRSIQRMVEAEILMELASSTTPLNVETLSERLGLYGNNAIQWRCQSLILQGRLQPVFVKGHQYYQLKQPATPTKGARHAN